MSGFSILATVAGFACPGNADAASISLGAASSFAVLGGQTVTNTGPSVITGDLGVSPGSSITGFPPGVVVGGSLHASDPLALQAQADLTDAYNALTALAGSGIAIGASLGGVTLSPGVYTIAADATLTGTLTLDAGGQTNPLFVILFSGTLTTATGSQMTLINGANADNVFFRLDTATLGTSSSISANVLALNSITANTGTSINGRLLARNGAVTLDTNVVTVPAAVPEPSVAVLGALGLLALARRKR